ncbi:MAG: hypothetical protein WCY97_10485 [Methanothrix sp.]|jgi:hypothetical protein|uniref:Uncharacterized protein n=1 Tax=Methanothrix harundinacea TaxID=301375 RepID=A0A117LFX2_9EURY|nr:MAG: Uncharacterized protein XD72_0699 [Methanothrix harundinacea]MDD2639165.1 hypothetical protein [Methanothrix sp.]MDI9399999.1 hypothetical protein [Euryarchaeota archaeon]KUK95183.1 MAG: Uncharacterized protein XE07_1921 [Methanothrix harundinacea]MCP1392304.1 hypothetical protein [Methanothrix harundinacea]
MADAEIDNKEELAGLYDLAIPIGMPLSVIQDLVDNFELDPVRRNAKIGLIDGDTEEREILVLRGDLETVKAAEKYMFEALDRRVARWEKNERSDRYKEIYDKNAEKRREMVRERIAERKDESVDLI